MLNKNTLSKYLPGLLFLILITLELLNLIVLIAGKRMVAGHDAFHHFALQYFFLNDVAVNNEVPLWIPYMSYGTTATWWYTIQGVCGIFPNTLFLLGNFIKNIHFLNIFYFCGGHSSVG